MAEIPMHQSGNTVFHRFSTVFLVFGVMSGYNKDIFEDRTKDTNEKSIKRKVNDMEFGTKLKTVREQKGITQQTLADHLIPAVWPASLLTDRLYSHTILHDEGDTAVFHLQNQ